jgi:ATP-dependent helicase/nuclease subunit A
MNPTSLPREMVLASAGSGKTYHLSSRLIGLMAMGETPDAIWASTFTRKAASEILDRVLLRLAKGALDDEAASELAKTAWFGAPEAPPPGFLTREECGKLLAGLVRSLHRANIGTLDSFFVQVASTFSEELGLPPTWGLVDGPVEDQMRSEALEAVLARENSASMAELVRIMTKGDARRGIHGHLLEQVENLLQIHRQVDPSIPEAWTPEFAGVSLGSSPTEEEIREQSDALADAFLRSSPPLTTAGKPNQSWQKELIRLSEVVRIRDWKAFFEKGLGSKLVEQGTLIPASDLEFYKKKPDAELATLLEESVVLARVELGRSVIRQGEALGRMAAHYRETFERAQETQGGFRFGDITHLLRMSNVMGTSDALYFRLDARIRHLLLDEFQDTSLPQWEVLDPLVTELLSSGEEERSAVVVADPKQSIYGWRGARPQLVGHVRDRYGLRPRELNYSYRSGPVILDAVGSVFRGMYDNRVVLGLGGGVGLAGSWLKDFYTQAPDDEGQPGYVRLLAGPRMEGRGGVQPALLDYASQVVADLYRGDPQGSVGVLVRTNKVVSYLIAALRQRGVPVSGEGGTPLTDTAPVNAILALLRMADHPGDRLARYHVAKTPLGEVVGFTHFQAGAEAGRLALKVRGRLLRRGYGATLDGLAKGLGPACDQREGARLQQLVELGFRWDTQRNLRPGDFVRFVEGQRVEDPSGASVRVMTIHQAKGLQFDTVVLPHLYDLLEGQGSKDPVVPLRDEATGRIVRVYPTVNKATRALLPELRSAHEQGRAHRLRDELSNLYVAMTRPRYALHMVVPADPEKGPGSAKSAARLLRAALAPGEGADAQGKILFEDGEVEWAKEVRVGSEGRAAEAQPSPTLGMGRSISLKPPPQARTRNLARRSPSSLEGGSTLELASLLRLDLRGDALLRGTVVHSWCESLGWMEEGLPDEPELLEKARRDAPRVEEARLRVWLSDFRVWLETPDIKGALSRSAYSTGARVERELPFLHRTHDGILQGYVDRLVLEEEGGRVVSAEVLDFKTDQVDGSDPVALTERVAFYRPQIEAYREAVASRYGLDLKGVRGTLLFLRAGVVRGL